jgi:hypothetical protein
MNIMSSDIRLFSSNNFLEKNNKSENPSIWTGKRSAWSSAAAKRRSSGDAAGRSQVPVTDRVTFTNSRNALKLHRPMHSDEDKKCSGCQESQSTDGKNDQISMMKQLIEKITGRSINIFNFESLDPGSIPSGGDTSIRADGDPALPDSGSGISCDYRESYTEIQTVSFSAQGTIKTADGQEINFSISLEISLEYHQESSLSFSTANTAQKDPLVVNYNGSASQLTSAKFSFDLNMDETQDNASSARNSSGLLLLNNDQGVIANDDSKLFGSATINGRSQPAASDGNHDDGLNEIVPVDDRLSAWTQTAPGTDQQSSLQLKSVGAINLSSIFELFGLKDNGSRLNARIDVTSLYADVSDGVKTH